MTSPGDRENREPTGHSANAAASGGDITLDNPEIRSVVAAINRLAYGTITITVHNSKVMQIDVTEKTRFST